MGRGNYEDKVGKKFGSLTILKVLEKTDKNWNVICEARCDCGTIKTYRIYYVLNGYNKSCGCGAAYSKKGLTTHPLHGIWYKMVQRCTDKENKSYKYYGAKGITVCEEWKNNYFVFYEWALANGYTKGLSLDRIDNRKGYSPDNCRWATNKMQANNMSTNVCITIDNVKKTFSQWCEHYDIGFHTARDRIYKHGWSVKEAFETPVGSRLGYLKRKRDSNGRFN
jgi:hypothetical protein